MAISVMQIYLISQADSLITICGISLIIVGLVGLIMIFMGVSDGNDKLIKAGRKLLYWLSIPLAICIFTPSSKTLAAMYIIPKIADSTFMQQVPDKLNSLANEWLNKQIKDIKAEENK